MVLCPTGNGLGAIPSQLNSHLLPASQVLCPTKLPVRPQRKESHPAGTLSWKSAGRPQTCSRQPTIPDTRDSRKPGLVMGERVARWPPPSRASFPGHATTVMLSGNRQAGPNLTGTSPSLVQETDQQQSHAVKFGGPFNITLNSGKPGSLKLWSQSSKL